MKHIIKKIENSSPLRRKANVGDELLSINGNEIRDVLDYKFHAYDALLAIELKSADGSVKSVKVRKSEGEDLGIEFDTYLMDRARHCANNCVFCFVDQMPKGMRETLYFKDDDARLSFLMGNYITLTNLSSREVQRIIDLRISPINVSVHTTNPELRVKMLRNPKAGESLEAMRRFAEAGITMNCQIVCCPGLNDGEELVRSMRDLAAMYPAVHSVSIVPVGLTKYRESLYELTPFNAESAAETIDLVTKFGDECIEKYGSRIFFCSDELYIKAGREIPEDEFFEDYAQLENGVGMLRLQEFEFDCALRCSDECDGVSFSVACGESAAPFLEKLIFKAKEKYDNINGKVYAIRNDFFGHSINVSGLITGQDLVAQLKGKDLGKRLFITQNMLRREEMDFLDDVTLEDASASLGVPIYPVEQDGGCLCDAFLGILPEVKLPVREKGSEEYYKYN